VSRLEGCATGQVSRRFPGYLFVLQQLLSWKPNLTSHRVPVMQDLQHYPNLCHNVAFQVHYFAGVNFQNTTTQSMKFSHRWTPLFVPERHVTQFVGYKCSLSDLERGQKLGLGARGSNPVACHSFKICSFIHSTWVTVWDQSRFFSVYRSSWAKAGVAESS